MTTEEVGFDAWTFGLKLQRFPEAPSPGFRRLAGFMATITCGGFRHFYPDDADASIPKATARRQRIWAVLRQKEMFLVAFIARRSTQLMAVAPGHGSAGSHGRGCLAMVRKRLLVGACQCEDGSLVVS